MVNASFKPGDQDAARASEAMSLSMCRMSTSAATAVALVLAAATPVLAKPAPKAPAASVEAPRRATPEERAMAQRLEPLGRAAFWARELDNDPSDESAGVALSQALRAMGKFDDAIEVAQRVLVARPTSVEGLLEMARAQIGRGQGFYAIDPARQAMALAPRDWRPASILGVAYEQADRPDEALAAHRQALALAPENPAVLTNLALFYANHGDAAQAEKMLRTAAARPDATVGIRQTLALVLGLQGRLDEAEKLARQDLPPEAVANNMAYLRAATGTASAAAERSWSAVRQAQ